jgi:predicted PurR-regulated permease PerM
VTHKIQNFQKNKKIPGVILKEIENLFDLVPKIIYQKINQYSIYLIQKSYIPGLKIINFIYFIILFLIFSFFTMNNWDKIVIMKNKFLGSYSLKIQEQINSFKILISKMLVGQIKVAIILFCFYTFFFWIFKFEYYIVLSLVFAVLTFIPIVGSILSIIILILSFYLLGTESSIIIKLSIVFVIGYLLENLYLTPSLVGSSLNVHPMLILIGLIMFSKFFGILGMSFALPVTAFLTKIINDYLCEIKIHNFK